jgi:uncharacterized membrane protein YtjA (UPF0391 family)
MRCCLRWAMLVIVALFGFGALNSSWSPAAKVCLFVGMVGPLVAALVSAVRAKV